jgi:hypothetical protein
MCTFYVLNDKRIYATLIKELDKVWHDAGAKMGYEALEKLPYLVSPFAADSNGPI